MQLRLRLSLALLAAASFAPLLHADAPGALDPSYTPPVTDQPVEAVVIQPDGKAIIAGAFTTVNGSKVSSIVRLKTDGTLDETFHNTTAGNLITGGTTTVSALALQSDGRILAIANGSTLARLGTDGTRDTAFKPTTNPFINSVAVQSTGLIIIGGVLDTVNGSPAYGIARLKADGTTDGSFVPPRTPSDTTVGLIDYLENLKIESDDKIVVAGSFSRADSSDVGGLARLTADGAIDATFPVVEVANTDFHAVGVQPDGDILLSGNFTTLEGQPIAHLARFSGEDGTLDKSFNTGTAFGGEFRGITVQADSKIICNDATDPDDTPLNPPLTRLNTDGSVDTDFTSGFVKGTSNAYAVALQADGKIVAVGSFLLASNATAGVVRLFAIDPDALTATTLKVNGSDQPTTVAQNAAITFTATQGSPDSSVTVKVQSSATPNVDSSWVDLPDSTNGGAGFLKGDGQGNYSLTTNLYPTGASIYFRAVSTRGTAQTFSNVVGSFNLSGAATPVLEIGQSASTENSPNASIALVGGQITYSFVVRNDGPATAFNVKVINVLPSSLHIESVDSDGTVTGGNTVTWTFPQLSPNATNPLTLKLVASVSADAPVGTLITNRGYSVQADGTGIIQGTDINTTTVIPPLVVNVRADGSTVVPGDSITYFVDVTNMTAGNVKKINVSVPVLPLSTASLIGEGFLDDNGQATSAPVKADGSANPLLNGTNLIFFIKKLKANGTAHFQLTFRIPYDVDPAAVLVLSGPQVTTKTSVGGINSFTLPDLSTPLSGNGPADPPHFTLGKFIPDPVSLLELLSDPRTSNILTTLFPTISSLDGILALGKLVNPDVLDATDANGIFRREVLAPGQSGGPTTSRITFALLVGNDGGTTVKDVVVTDRIPPGTQLDLSEGLAPTYNGQPLDANSLSVDPDGRTIHFKLGKVKRDKPATADTPEKPSLGLVLYTVDLLPPGAGGVSLDAPIQAQGGTLTTPYLASTTYAQPAEIDTYVTAPGAAYLESYKGTPVATVTGQIPYDIYYRNTGGMKAKDFRIVDAIPAGTSFVSADFLDINHVVRAADGQKSENIDKPAAGATSGSVTFHLGKVKRGGDGFVRLVVKVEDSAFDAAGLLVANHPFVPKDVFSVDAQESIGRRVAAAVRPQDDPVADALAAADNFSRVQLDSDYLASHPGSTPVPHLAVGISAPMSVREGESYDCLVFTANLTDTLIGKAAVAVLVPPGAEFVSGELIGDTLGEFKGVLETDDAGKPAVIFPPTVNDDATNFVDNNVQPHSANLYRVVFRTKSGTSGGALVVSAHTQTTTYSMAIGVAVAPVYSGNICTYVYGQTQPFPDVASQVYASTLALHGNSPANLTPEDLKNRIGLLSEGSVGSSVGGADALVLNNNTSALPIGGGNVVVYGARANIVASGAGNLISQDGSNIVAAGAGNVISPAHLISQDGSNIVASGAGNFKQVFAGIVASGAGNIVAAGAGNLYNGGGLNLFADDKLHVVSNDGGSLFPITASIVAAGAGNIVASGAGNIVASGAGNIVASGAGNIVASGAGNLGAVTAGNLVNTGGGAVTVAGKEYSSADGSCATNLSGAGIGSVTGGNTSAINADGIVSTNGSN